MHKILYCIHFEYSARDYYGNCYWAATITRTSDGAIARGLIAHNSNLLHAFFETGIDGSRIQYTISERKKRDWSNKWRTKNNYMTIHTGWPCGGKELYKAVMRALRQYKREQESS